ncbi:MAG: hypothetical protein MUE60_10850 [Candidatus Eisenbacteria bacterium]|nr:hypothetical protein [Candidatus Eisenbacteria bacterium]
MKLHACVLVFAGVMLTVLPASASGLRPDTTWVVTFDHDFYNWADPHIQTFQLPPDSLMWEKILLYYKIQCPPLPGDCDPWDRLGHIRVVTTDTSGTEVHTEIARIVTPYDITGGTRPDSCIWELDVSDYESLLHDSVTLRHQITTWIGGNKGWIVTVTFAFISGATPLEPFQVTNLWTHEYLVFGDPDNPIESFLQPVAAPIPPEAQGAKVRAITTGHGQGNTGNAAEFSNKWHEVSVGAEVYSHNLWRNDCNLNECSPQGGTWTYARAGWCPGDKVIPWDVDVWHAVTPGTSVSIDYNIQPYINYCRPTNPDCRDGVTCTDCDYNYTGHTEPNYCLHAQLILYRERMMHLSGTRSANGVLLSWPAWPGAAAYWVFGEANTPYFEPVLTPPHPNRLAVLDSDVTNWDAIGGAGDPLNNWTYVVYAVDDAGLVLGKSTRVGEHDFAGEIPGGR